MEIAPMVVVRAGIQAVLAKSFARTFFRNAVNLGLLLVTCDTEQITGGDELALDLEQGLVRNITRHVEIPFSAAAGFDEKDRPCRRRHSLPWK